MKQLYYCCERGVYEGNEYYGWFENDRDAIKAFKEQAWKYSWNNEEGHEWYVGRVIEFDGVVMSLKTEEVVIFKTCG